MSARLSALLVSARSAMLAGEVDDAGRHLSEAMGLAGDDAERSAVLCLRARLAVMQGRADDLVTELTAFSADAEPVPAGMAVLEAVILKLYLSDADALEWAHRGRDLLASADAVTRARADLILGLAKVFAGQVEDAEDLLARSADLIRLGGAPDEVAHLLQQVVVGLAGRELYDEGVALCRRSIRAIRAVGADGLLPLTLCYLANTIYFTAGFAEQEMAAAEALDLARAGGQPPLAAYARVCRAVAMGLRGDAGAARAELEECLHDVEASGAGTFRNLTLLGLALLDLGDGDWAAAARAFARLRANWERDRVMAGILHWRGDEVEALWRCGDRERALARLDELAADADADGYGPWERAVIARMRGFTGGPGGESHFAEALRWHARSTSAFERARTDLCWGEWLLDRGRPAEARERLQLAAESFTELDTPAWARRAGSLLARTADDEPPRSVPAYRITAFGVLTVTSPDGTGVRVAMDTPGNLLRVLTVEDGSMHVEHMVERLWPGTEYAQGAGRLRTVLTRTRQRYGPVVVREGTALRWADGVDVDVHRFAELHRRAVGLGSGAPAAALARAAIELYVDDLLVLERYDDVVAGARERLRQRYLDLIDLLAGEERASGNLRAATDLLRSGVERDHLNEVRYLDLAELLIEQGQAGSARTVLTQVRSVVAELGLPEPARLARLFARC